MYVLTSKYDPFTHRVGDTESLKDLVFGLTMDSVKAHRIAIIAGQMRIGEGFATDGILLTCEEDI